MKKIVHMALFFVLSFVFLIGLISAQNSNQCTTDSDCKISVVKENSCIDNDFEEGCNAAGNTSCFLPDHKKADYCKCENNKCVGKQNSPGCKTLYWFDNENKECGQKEFCGAYMYYGLQTFESKTQCEKALNPENKTFNLSNGRKAEIKIMPETASQRAIERLGELGFTIELKEVGKGDEAKAVYELTGNKEGKFLGIFKIMARVQAQVDAETGDVKVIKPWWAFLASGI